MLRTKKQEQELCPGSPLAKTAHLIGDTCTLLIVRDLLCGPKHFGDLEVSLSGISTRTVTKKLKSLCEAGILNRKEIVGKPIRVEYSLTKKGKGLHGITEEMTKYGEKFLK